MLLLAASYIFYAAWSPPYVLLLLLSTIVDWWLARKIAAASGESRRRFLLDTQPHVQSGLLAYFKYANFLLDNLSSLLSGNQAYRFNPCRYGHHVLPLAISFYTFASLSYTIDVYRREIAADTIFYRLRIVRWIFPPL